MIVDDSDFESRLSLGKLIAIISVMKNFEMIVDPIRLFSRSDNSFLGFVFDTLEKLSVQIVTSTLFGKKSLAEQVMVACCVFAHTLTSDTMKIFCQFLLSRLLQTRSSFVELLILTLLSYMGKLGIKRAVYIYGFSLTIIN
jgi:hypothetical protein